MTQWADIYLTIGVIVAAIVVWMISSDGSCCDECAQYHAEYAEDEALARDAWDTLSPTGRVIVAIMVSLVWPIFPMALVSSIFSHAE